MHMLHMHGPRPILGCAASIPTLIKIMDEDFNNHKCGHCVTKGDYINELKRLAKARARKAGGGDARHEEL